MASTKYNGNLHYRYPTRVIQESAERLVTFTEPGVSIESYRGSKTGKRHLLSVFWRNRSYVLHVVWTSQWQPEFVYIDIATATDWTEQTVHYIDLELDLILRPRLGFDSAG